MKAHEAIAEYPRIRIARAVEAFKKRGFAAHSFETSAEAGWILDEISIHVYTDIDHSADGEHRYPGTVTLP